MEPQEHLSHDEVRFARIRRVKRLLRYVPRKATLHKYPFLKFFAASARKRHYLWSFRAAEVVPALYAGFILTFTPLYGVQIPIALALALIFRANLMILVGLQLISNPLTIVPIYAAAYQVGHFCVDLIGVDSAEMAEPYVAETGAKLSLHGLKVIRYFFETMLGGAIMGYFSGLISVIVYKSFIGRFMAKVQKTKAPKDEGLVDKP